MSISDYSVTVYQNADTHKLLNDLYVITRNQIETLLAKVKDGDELNTKDLKSLDMCYDGLRKLIIIQKELGTDKMASLPDDELRSLARKAIREEKKND